MAKHQNQTPAVVSSLSVEQFYICHVMMTAFEMGID